VAGGVGGEGGLPPHRGPLPPVFLGGGMWGGAARFFFFVGPFFFFRTRGEPPGGGRDLSAVVRPPGDRAPPSNVATLDQLLSNSVTLPRMYAVLVSVFSLLALMLAVVGIHGVVAYWVATRTREIGIRLALGARPGAICGLILAQSATMAGFGVA